MCQELRRTSLVKELFHKHIFLRASCRTSVLQNRLWEIRHSDKLQSIFVKGKMFWLKCNRPADRNSKFSPNFLIKPITS